MRNSSIAKHLKEVFIGGNWTSVNLKDTLIDVNIQKANSKVGNLHSIAELVFHIDYFVKAIICVLKSNTLNAHDKFSFDLPAITSEPEWKDFIDVVISDALECSNLIESITDERLDDIFVDIKYGTYERNLLGVIEHTHYHLGQIVILKKMLS